MRRVRGVWSKSEVARRAGIATGTFSQWYSGSYQGRYDTTTQKVENFLASVEEGMELDANMLVEPNFIDTRLSRELFAAFVYAQKLPTIAIATVVAGMGKTIAAERFQSTRPHVFHITLSPSSSNPYLLKMEIAEHLGIQTRDAAKLKSAIANALHRDGHSALMILDEAQRCAAHPRTPEDQTSRKSGHPPSPTLARLERFGSSQALLPPPRCRPAQKPSCAQGSSAL